MEKNYKIINAKVVLPGDIISGSVEINNGVIVNILPNNSIESEGAEIIDAAGKFILPGFIDVHTNGISGFDLTSGIYDLDKKEFIADEDRYLAGLDFALREYAATGVTKAVLTSLAAPLDQLKKVFSLVNKYKQKNGESIFTSVLGGLYVEGTFMKLVEYRGAHNPEYFNEPSVELFKELFNAAGKIIKVVNVVPEWGDPAFKLIKYLSSRNIVCAAGHTGASGFLYEKAIKSGLQLAVHFLNGPTGSSSKSLDGGGAVENVLKAKNMFVELIVDGYHVDKSYVMDTIKRKGFEKVIAITDSMFAARMDDLREFNVFGVNGVISPNGEYIQIADREYALFGSKLTMDIAFSNLLNWLTNPIEGVWYEMHEPFSFEEAVLKASMMCSANPARILGIYEANEANPDNNNTCTGSVQIGKTADLLLADIIKQENLYKINIDKIFVNGNKIENS